MTTWEQDLRNVSFRHESLSGTRIPLIQGIESGGFRSYVYIMNLVAKWAVAPPTDITTTSALVMYALELAMDDADERGDEVEFERIYAHYLHFEDTLADINMGFESFEPQVALQPHEDVPTNKSHVSLFTSTSMRVIASCDIQGKVQVMGCGNANKEQAVLAGKPVEPLYIDSNVAKIANLDVPLKHCGDLNEHCDPSFSTTFLFFSTLGYVQPWNIRALEDGHRIYGMAYVANFLNEATEPKLIDSAVPQLSGVIPKFGNVNENAVFFETFQKHEFVPTIFFVGDLRVTPGVETHNFFRSHCVICPKQEIPFQSVLPSDSYTVNLTFHQTHDNLADLFGRPKTHPLRATIRDLLNYSPFYVCDKTDGFQFFFFLD